MKTMILLLGMILLAFLASVSGLAWLVEIVLVILVAIMAMRVRVAKGLAFTRLGHRQRQLAYRALRLPKKHHSRRSSGHSSHVENKEGEKTATPLLAEFPTQEMIVYKEPDDKPSPQNDPPQPTAEEKKRDAARFLYHVAVGQGIVYNKKEVVLEQSHSSYPSFCLYSDGSLRLAANLMGCDHSETYYDKRHISYVYDYVGKPAGDQFRFVEETEHPQVAMDGDVMLLSSKGKVVIE